MEIEVGGDLVVVQGVGEEVGEVVGVEEGGGEVNEGGLGGVG